MAITHGTTDPASRFRIVQYLPFFARAGWNVSHRSKAPDSIHHPILRLLCSPWRKWTKARSRRRDIRDSADYDVVFQNRDLLAGKLVWEQLLASRNPRLIFDFDDAIFLGKRRSHVEWLCRNAAWVTAGNEYLAEFARQFTSRVTMVPTVVDTAAYVVRTGSQSPGRPFRLGWLGSGHSIRETLFPHLEMLAAIQRDVAFEFVVVSSPRPILPETGLRWTFIEWSPKVETRVAGLFDAGIMPLVDNEFQRGKCGLKLLQYMAAGLPVIASPVGVNREFVPGRGFLAAGPGEWRTAIERLAADPALCASMGAAGRTYCTAGYDMAAWAPKLITLAESVASERDSKTFFQ